MREAPKIARPVAYATFATMLIRHWFYIFYVRLSRLLKHCYVMVC